MKPATSREPYATIGERVNDRDREFFRNHPHEAAYLRRYIPGEHSPESLAAAGMKPPRQDEWVLVWNLSPGIRCRQHVGRVVGGAPIGGRMTLIGPDGVIAKGVIVVGLEDRP